MPTPDTDPGPVPPGAIDIAPSSNDLLMSLRTALIDAGRADREYVAAKDRQDYAAANSWAGHGRIALALAAHAAQELDARLTRGGELPAAWRAAR